MNTVREERELVVDLPPRATKTDGVLEVLAECGITVLSCLHYGNFENVLLVTDDPDKAATVLKLAGYRCRMENVVLVGVADGDRWAGLRVGQALHSGGVRILHSYMSQTLSGHSQAVFQTSDNQQALHILTSDHFHLAA